MNTVTWEYATTYLKGEEIVWVLFEKELQKVNQNKFGVESVIKRKGDRLYVKGKD